MSAPAALVAVRSDADPAGPPAAGPAVVLLHGFGSHEHDLAGLGPHLGPPWVSLRAPLALPHGGFAWFPIVTPGDPEPEPVARATEAVWAWVDAELGPERQVAPVGFSQGGLMATQLLRTRPERVAATVVLGGFVQAAEQPADAVLAASRPPVFWGRGADDRVIAPHAIDRTAAWLPGRSTLVERVYPGLAHGIDARELADVRAFLGDALGQTAA
ncbi:phospholipase/carboxylesterase [Cellulosimicrobium cellulans]|uniref:alpha/beta hydrolase n=1 Tax=Cellulosimicrobium cellulans TaxID=1710 RepID=UPI0019562E1D|nr:dienelactone hydrolase family protein [Cellulosimicrobium cellulans]MBM7820981.1 phospholipase/carboxylesterase [Cellulosimicrobium cellulans]